jgi:phage FluMu gp28-like protein
VPEPTKTLLPYQRAWLKDRSKFKIGMVTRQGGKSKFMLAPEVIEHCLDAEAQRVRARWVWLSSGERQAVEAMREGVKPWGEAYDVGINVYQDSWKSESGTEYKSAEIEFKHGSRITALPANPDTARGFTANLALDEFAIHKNSREIWSAAFPMISRSDLWLRVMSTPKGKKNKFYDLMTAQGELWSKHTVDIYQAVNQGLDRDIAQLREACGDEEVWQQEYALKWLDEADAWLPFDTITACEDEAAGDPAKYQGGYCFVGNDIGARGDLWVAWVWEVVGDVLWCREIKTLHNKKFAEHDAEMARIFGQYKVARLTMDQTGMGEKPVEDAKRRYPGRVDGVLFTAPAKMALATVGKAAFEDRKVRIPAGDLALRTDLHKLKKVVGPTGIPRFIAERDSAGHADRTWAAFLGVAGADVGNVEPNIWFGDDADDDSEAAIIGRIREREGAIR